MTDQSLTFKMTAESFKKLNNELLEAKKRVKKLTEVFNHAVIVDEDEEGITMPKNIFDIVELTKTGKMYDMFKKNKLLELTIVCENCRKELPHKLEINEKEDGFYILVGTNHECENEGE